MHLYTDEIEFALFGSKENRESRSPEFIFSYDDRVSRPSPKSIYRLADKVCHQVLQVTRTRLTPGKFRRKYDVPALKGLALDQIRHGLAKCDIVQEAFSRFAFQ